MGHPFVVVEKLIVIRVEGLLELIHDGGEVIDFVSNDVVHLWRSDGEGGVVGGVGKKSDKGVTRVGGIRCCSYYVKT